MATTNIQEIYRRPHLTTITYAVGLLLFLLPFFNIQCNNITMATISGISMATGGKAAISDDMEKMGSGFSKDFGDSRGTVKTTRGGEGKLFVSALLALILGVVGLALSLVSKGRNQRPAMIVGLLSVIALAAAWIEISFYVKSNAKSGAGENAGSDFAGMVRVSASPTFWFILSLLCFAASAYISYKRSQETLVADTPPHGAPQLKIENPGEQSEFPAAPHEERDLG